MISAQGGDAEYIRNPSLFEKAKYIYNVSMPENGYITHMNAEGIGSVCVMLGAGRKKKEDNIDPTAGIVLRKKTGDYAEKGEIIATLYASDETVFESAYALFLGSISSENKKPQSNPLLLGIVE